MNKHFPDGWSLQPDKCPADLEFREILLRPTEHVSYPRNILHMGTGLHHTIGLLGAISTSDFTLGLTIAPEELLSYIKIIEERAWVSAVYKVLLTDIHMLHAQELGKFDFISLFHLGEIVPYPMLGSSLAGVIDEMVKALKPNGVILAYSKSAAWDIVQPLFDEMLELVETYKTLRIYKAK